MERRNRLQKRQKRQSQAAAVKPRLQCSWKSRGWKHTSRMGVVAVGAKGTSEEPRQSLIEAAAWDVGAKWKVDHCFISWILSGQKKTGV